MSRFGVKFKIIPVLVLVAMISFSVRFVEVISDYSAFGGGAQADEVQSNSKDKPFSGFGKMLSRGQGDGVANASQQQAIRGRTAAEIAESIEPAAGDAQADDKMMDEAMDDKPMSDSGDAAEGASLDDDKWRDPGDQDPGYAAVRREVYDELSARRRDISSREKDIMTREALLKAAEKEIDRKFEELKQLRGEIEILLGKQSEEEKARLKSLVTIYENMKPKDAARIFDTLDLDILVSVMGQMSERKLSPVIAAMNDERARTITIMLAEQKQLPSLPNVN